MGWPHIEVSENGRSRIAKAAAVLNVISVPLCVILLITGTYIQIAVQNKVRLIEGLNVDVLPGFMISVGIIGVISNLFASRVCWVNHQPEKRQLWRKYLFPCMISTFIVYLSVFTSGIVCFSQIAALRDSFQRGLSTAMNEYSTDILKKIELDTLQIEFRCCGCDSYTDWFHVPWIREDYVPPAKKKILKAKSKDGKYRNDDVPFSCCNPNFLRPCVHHHVHDNYKHYNYDYRAEVTLYTQGCKEALMDFYGGEILTEIGLVIIIISFIQLTLVILVRILQTSIDNAMESEDPEDSSVAYIFPFGQTALKNVKKGIKKLHKGNKDEYPSTMPLLDEYGMEIPTETPAEEAAPPEDDIYNISVTGSFVSDFDSDKDQQLVDQPDRLENTYVSIPSLPRTSTKVDAQFPPPSFPSVNQMYSEHYSPQIPNFPPPPPPPPPPPLDVEDYPDYDTPYPERQGYIGVRSAHRYVNDM